MHPLSMHDAAASRVVIGRARSQMQRFFAATSGSLSLNSNPSTRSVLCGGASFSSCASLRRLINRAQRRTHEAFRSRDREDACRSSRLSRYSLQASLALRSCAAGHVDASDIPSRFLHGKVVVLARQSKRFFAALKCGALMTRPCIDAAERGPGAHRKDRSSKRAPSARRR